MFYNSLDKKEEALSDINKAIELEPENDVSYYYRGSFYEEEEELELALADYLKAVELDPQDSENYFRVAFVSYELGQYDIALSSYLLYIKQFGEDHAVYHNMALIYQNDLEDYEKALEYYNKAIEIEPNDPDYYENRSNLFYNSLDKKEEALSDLNTLVELEPSNHSIRADFFHNIEEYGKAVEDIRSAINLGESNFVYDYNYLFYDLGINLSLSGQYSEAVKSIKKYSEGLSDDSSISFAYGEIAYIYQDGLKDYDKARGYYLMGVKKDSLNTSNYIGLGDLSLLEKDYNKSLGFFNKAVEIEPGDVNPYYARINFYIKKEKFDLAIGDIISVRKLSPDDPDSYYKEAIVNNKLNRIKAIQNITTAIEKQTLSLKNDSSGNEYYLYNGTSGYLQKRIYLEDLYLFRSDLFYKYGDLGSYCNDLQTALRYVSSEKHGIKKTQGQEESLKNLVNEKCN